MYSVIFRNFHQQIWVVDKFNTGIHSFGFTPLAFTAEWLLLLVQRATQVTLLLILDLTSFCTDCIVINRVSFRALQLAYSAGWLLLLIQRSQLVATVLDLAWGLVYNSRQIDLADSNDSRTTFWDILTLAFSAGWLLPLTWLIRTQFNTADCAYISWTDSCNIWSSLHFYFLAFSAGWLLPLNWYIHLGTTISPTGLQITLRRAHWLFNFAINTLADSAGWLLNFCATLTISISQSFCTAILFWHNTDFRQAVHVLTDFGTPAACGTIPGPKSGRSRILRLLLFCAAFGIMTTIPSCRSGSGGEGCGLSTRATEIPPDWATTFIPPMGMKPSGTQPAVGSGIHWRPMDKPISKVVKRSLHRAFNRAVS